MTRCRSTSVMLRGAGVSGASTGGVETSLPQSECRGIGIPAPSLSLSVGMTAQIHLHSLRISTLGMVCAKSRAAAERGVRSVPACMVGVVAGGAPLAVIALPAAGAMQHDLVRSGEPVFVDVEIGCVGGRGGGLGAPGRLRSRSSAVWSAYRVAWAAAAGGRLLRFCPSWPAPLSPAADWTR